MAIDENMLLSDMATETRRTQRAMQQRARDTKRSAAAKGAGKSIDLEDAMTRREKMESVGREAASKVRQKVQATPVKSTSKVMPANDPSTISRSSRRMMSGLLENAPKKQTSTLTEPMIGPRRGRMRPVGEKATSVGTFTKSPEPTPNYDGHHVAMYVGSSKEDFELAFSNIEQAGVVWINPRFSDKAGNLNGAKRWKQFRFKDIIDLKTGAKIFQLEHEMRSIEHEAWPGKTL